MTPRVLWHSLHHSDTATVHKVVIDERSERVRSSHRSGGLPLSVGGDQRAPTTDAQWFLRINLPRRLRANPPVSGYQARDLRIGDPTMNRHRRDQGVSRVSFPVTECITRQRCSVERKCTALIPILTYIPAHPSDPLKQLQTNLYSPIQVQWRSLFGKFHDCRV